MTELTVSRLRVEGRTFAAEESSHHEPLLYGVTDGKRVGTYLEHKFRAYLREHYEYEEGSSAKGIDFPVLGARAISDGGPMTFKHVRPMRWS